jgi:hypothetical protein
MTHQPGLRWNENQRPLIPVACGQFSFRFAASSREDFLATKINDLVFR